MDKSSALTLSIFLLLMVGEEINVDASVYDTVCKCSVINETSSICMTYSCESSERRGKCFSGSSQVTLVNGTKKMLSQVEVGDEVLVDENERYEPILDFIHLDRTGLFDFMTIEIRSRVSNKTYQISASPNHLIFNFDSNNADFAGRFYLGDRVQLVENNRVVAGEITGIRLTKQQGFYAPLTSSGTIVIDGVLASNYATVSSHRLAHRAMSVYRCWVRLFGALKSKKLVYWVLEAIALIDKLIRWCGGHELISNYLYNGIFHVSAVSFLID